MKSVQTDLIPAWLASRIWFVAGWALLLVSYTYVAERLPGLHFDEAWSGNFAARIATEPGFWPIRAMSPYTSAWDHYVIAAFFKFFGIRLAVFRAAGAALALGGLALLSRALRGFGETTAADLLPWIAGTSLAVLANHRFGIEITTFHGFCFGLLIHGLSVHYQHPLRRRGLIEATAAILLGITSHLLFLAPVLALLFAGLVRPGARQLPARWIGLTTLALLPFLIATHLGVPEKDKTFALLVAALLLLGWTLRFGARNPLRENGQRQLLAGLAIVAAPFLVFLAVFFEGHWSVLLTHGQIHLPSLIGWSLIPAGFFAVAALHPGIRAAPGLPREWLGFGAALLAVTGGIMLKPTPRYLELPLLTLLMLLALGAARIPAPRRCLLLSAQGLIFVAAAGINYFGPAGSGESVDRSFRLFVLHDRSTDFLPKHELVAALGTLGCRIDQLSVPDPRLYESLRFLSHQDWPLAPGVACPASRVVVGKREMFNRPLGLGGAYAIARVSGANESSP